MTIRSAMLPGVFLIEAEPRGDERGYLVRTFCERRFREADLNTNWPQSSLTFSAARATLRGMHFQADPCSEIKLVRCVSGSVWDCLIDLRPESETFRRWEAFELSEENAVSLYVPQGIAHGFLTLTDGVRMLYSMSAEYSPEHAFGVRWNDPAFAVKWPSHPSTISSNDETWPLFEE